MFNPVRACLIAQREAVSSTRAHSLRKRNVRLERGINESIGGYGWIEAMGTKVLVAVEYGTGMFIQQEKNKIRIFAQISRACSSRLPIA